MAPPLLPDDHDWVDVLHEAIKAVGSDDPDLSFLASLLHQAIDRPGLTEKQAKWAGRIVKRVRAERPARFEPPQLDLASLPSEGTA